MKITIELKRKFVCSYVRNPETGCWDWVRTKDKDGYGRMTIDHNTEIRAHRFSYQLHLGKIPEGMFVCHSCDNPSCVNPKHLFVGTVLDNHRDMDRKGRRVSVSGERHGSAKLKAGHVRAIRGLYENKKHTQEELAKIYKVSRRLIGMIINNKIWK